MTEEWYPPKVMVTLNQTVIVVHGVFNGLHWATAVSIYAPTLHGYCGNQASEDAAIKGAVGELALRQ